MKTFRPRRPIRLILLMQWPYFPGIITFVVIAFVLSNKGVGAMIGAFISAAIGCWGAWRALRMRIDSVIDPRHKTCAIG